MRKPHIAWVENFCCGGSAQVMGPSYLFQKSSQYLFKEVFVILEGLLKRCVGGPHIYSEIFGKTRVLLSMDV